MSKIQETFKEFSFMIFKVIIIRDIPMVLFKIQFFVITQLIDIAAEITKVIISPNSTSPLNKKLLQFPNF